MSDPSDLPPLDDELASLLRAEANTQAGPSAEISRSMLSRLEAALPISLPLPDVSGTGPATDAARTAVGTAKGAALGKAVVGTSLLAKLVVGAALVGSGMVAGAGMHAAMAPRPEVRVVTKTVEVRVPVYLPAPAATVPLPAPAAVPDDAGVKKHTGAPSGEPAQDERDRLLEKENALITRAQSALARREAALAIGALEAHAERFEKGQLSEEREALWIQALAMKGDTGSAKTRAERFRKHYPRSMLMPAVDAAVRGAP